MVNNSIIFRWVLILRLSINKLNNCRRTKHIFHWEAWLEKGSLYWIPLKLLMSSTWKNKYLDLMYWIIWISYIKTKKKQLKSFIRSLKYASKSLFFHWYSPFIDYDLFLQLAYEFSSFIFSLLKQICHTKSLF